MNVTKTRNIDARSAQQGGVGIKKNMKAIMGAGLLAAVSPMALVGGAFLMSAELTTANAQDFTTGQLRGVVADAAGNPVAGATVTLSDESVGYSQSTTTNSNGEYRFARLQIGTYKITTEIGGETVESTLRVRAGAVDTVDLVAGGTEAPEEIVVRGTRRVVQRKDFKSQESGIIVDTDDLIVRVPVIRDIARVALLAPGATENDPSFDGNFASFGGSSIAENSFYVNGFNFTDIRRFTGTTNEIPFEFFQQIDIKTGGFQAEYGRATGGITNLVTRRGTNEFSGGASIFYTPEGLRGDEVDTTDIFRSKDRRTETEINTWLSGPIIEDRLFFYGLVSFRDDDVDNFTNSTLEVEQDDDPLWGFNIDAVLWDDPTFGYHTFTYTHIDDQRQIFTTTFDYDRETDELGGQRGVSTENRGGTTDIAKYTGVVRDWLTLSVLYGSSTARFDEVSDTANNPAILDSRGETTVSLGNFTNFTETAIDNDRRRLWRADADIFVNDFFGDHSIRIGFDKETLISNEASQRSGGVLYRYFADGTGLTRFNPNAETEFADTEIARVGIRETSGSFTSTRTAYYIQDRWEPIDRLTLNLGFRLENFENEAIDGTVFVDQENLFDYRLGFTYDLFGDESARVFGFAGTYHLPVANNTNVRLAGSEVFERDFFILEGLNPDDTPILGDFIGTDVVSPGGVQDPRTLTVEGLDAQKSREFILGYEQAVGDNWTVGVRGIYRQLRVGLEDGALDRGVLNFAEDNNLDVDAIAEVFSGFHAFRLFNPGEDATTFITAEDAMSDPALFALLGGDPDGDGLVPISLTAEQIALPEQRRKYRALEFTAERSFVDGWSVQASYVLARVTGNNEGGVRSDNAQTDTGLTTNFDTAGLAEGISGRLPNDRRHTFKVFGSYALSDTITLGGNFTLQSPRAFGCIGPHPTDEIASQFGAASFYCRLDENNRPSASAPSRLTPRGSILESDWTKQLDISANFTPDWEILGNLTPSFRVDVFNIFNTHDVTDRNEFGQFGSGAIRETYGDPTGFLRPRTVRLSARMEF